jgi:hypothetical protein
MARLLMAAQPRQWGICPLLPLAQTHAFGMCVVDLVQATASGTAAFFKRAQQCATGGPFCASRPLFARMPRTGLSLSRTTFGGDNVGASTGERSRAMWAALKSRRCNTVLINLNELADRRRPTSPMFARDGTSQLWEVGTMSHSLAPFMSIPLAASAPSSACTCVCAGARVLGPSLLMVAWWLVLQVAAVLWRW